jgi:hypothetical protein
MDTRINAVSDAARHKKDDEDEDEVVDGKHTNANFYFL